MTATVRLSDGSSQQLLDENGEENVCGDVSYSLGVTSDGASIDSIVLKDTTENKKYDSYDINYIGFSFIIKKPSTQIGLNSNAIF